MFFTHWSPFDEMTGNGLDQEFPNLLCEELRNIGVNAAHMEVDLSRSESATLIMYRVEAMLRTPNILVNNAAFESPANFQRDSGQALRSEQQRDTNAVTGICEKV